jgi:hypothetical protein
MTRALRSAAPLLAMILALPGCAARAETPLLRYIHGAELQAEGDAQACLVAQALSDLATLGAQEAAGRTYGTPPVPVARLLSDHLVPAQPSVLPDDGALAKQAADPATRAALAALAEASRRGRDCPP